MESGSRSRKGASFGPGRVQSSGSRVSVAIDGSMEWRSPTGKPGPGYSPGLVKPRHKFQFFNDLSPILFGCGLGRGEIGPQEGDSGGGVRNSKSVRNLRLLLPVNRLRNHRVETKLVKSNPNPPALDRRRTPRLPLLLPVRLFDPRETVTASRPLVLATTQDVGPEGLYFRSFRDLFLMPGAEVRVRLTVPIRDGAVTDPGSISIHSDLAAWMEVEESFAPMETLGQILRVESCPEASVSGVGVAVGFQALLDFWALDAGDHGCQPLSFPGR